MQDQFQTKKSLHRQHPPDMTTGAHELVNFVLQSPQCVTISNNFAREFAGPFTINKTKERFRHVEIWLIGKLLSILHFILELQYTLEDSTNKTYHCAL